MKGDMPLAAISLMSRLPTHTHEQRRGAYYLSNEAAAEARRRRIRIGSMVYNSIREASRAERRATKTIWQWLQNGNAEYV